MPRKATAPQPEDDLQKLSRVLEEVRAARLWHHQAQEEAQSPEPQRLRSSSLARDATRRELRMLEGKLALERAAVNRQPSLGERAWSNH